MVTDELQTGPPPAVAPAPARRGRVRTIEPRQPSFGYAVAEIWRYRRYTTFFGWRFLRKAYMGTFVGLPWLFLRPILDVGLKVFVFGGLIGITSGGIPYPLFVLMATAAWQVFAEALTWAVRSLYMSRSLLQAVHVPRLVVVLGTIVPTAVHFLIVLGITALMVVYYVIADGTTYLSVSWSSPAYIVGGLGLLLLQGVGLGIVAAVLGARTREVRFILAYLLGFFYFLTPILYSFQNVPERFRLVSELTPMTGAMELFKAGIFGTPFPPTLALAVSIVAVLVIWGPGFWLFHRQEVREW
jgi:lipopolysaccharide transport system permease protein